MKQKDNKLKEKSVIISQSNFQSSTDKQDNSMIKSNNTNNDRYDDINYSNTLNNINKKRGNQYSNDYDIVNMKSGLGGTFKNIDINASSMSSSRYKVLKKRDELTKEEIEQNEKINFNNYADDIIESFFEKNKIDSPDFFFDLANEMQNGQRHINYKLKKMIEDDEINNSRLNQKKQEYITKLENIKKKHSQFENKVNNLNELYCKKLSDIYIISKNLYEY